MARIDGVKAKIGDLAEKLEELRSFLKKKFFKDLYTKRKWTIRVKIFTLILISFFIYSFYVQLKEPVYCCGESTQKTIDDTVITYNYDIKTEGGTIKTEKPVIFILYRFGLSVKKMGMEAEHPSENITSRICVDGARNIETGIYDPCINISLKKTSEPMSGEGYFDYEFVNGNGFEWKRKFIVPIKENISFDEKPVEYIDVIPRQQSDVSIFYPFLIAITTIFSLIMDAYSKYLEIQQEELKIEE